MKICIKYAGNSCKSPLTFKVFRFIVFFMNKGVHQMMRKKQEPDLCSGCRPPLRHHVMSAFDNAYIREVIGYVSCWVSEDIAMDNIHDQLKYLQAENAQLKQKIDDMRIIDRAKCLLISCLSMSEQEAHRYIEKQAMDMRETKRAIAEGILKTYEN